MVQYCPYIYRKQGYVAESYQNQLKNLFHQKEKKLRKELEKLAKNRDLHRHGRERLSVPIVAVVGYTNAGSENIVFGSRLPKCFFSASLNLLIIKIVIFT